MKPPWLKNGSSDTLQPTEKEGKVAEREPGANLEEASRLTLASKRYLSLKL